MSYTPQGAIKDLDAFFTTQGTGGNCWIYMKSGGAEITGNGASRIQISTSDFTAAALDAAPNDDRAIRSNTTVFSWTASGGDFGTVNGIGIADAAVGGTEIWSADDPAPETVTDGNTFQLPAGAVALRVT